MKVFLSWSGERSRSMAEVLKTWLPDVIQAVQPWMSSQDITKGSRGLRTIADELSGTSFGIVCVTPENQHAPWINFEAGALSKEVDNALVVPLLLDLDVAQLTGPLAQFQVTRANDEEDCKKLLSDMNATLGEAAIPQERLSRAFDRNWNDLRTSLRAIGESNHEDGARKPNMTERDLLAEVLVSLRQQERRLVDIETLLQQNASISNEKLVIQNQPRSTPAALRKRLLNRITNILSNAGVDVNYVKWHDDVLVVSVPRFSEPNMGLHPALRKAVAGFAEQNKILAELIVEENGLPLDLFGDDHAKD